MFAALARSLTTPDTILWSALTLLILAGAVSGSVKLPTASSAVTGFGNSGLVTVGFLFVIVEGSTRIGTIDISNWFRRLMIPSCPVPASR